MATRKPKENDASLPFAALQLLAPPVRLVSAAIWKVMKQRDVMQYGVVEEFVTSACETVPGLLTVRHQGKLVLGLRGRLILELCCKQPDEEVIKPHLERLRAPTALSTPSAPTVKRDVKILKTVESLHSLVHTLLTDPAEREYFFKEEFPVDYGPTFDLELEKLLWEFLIRVDQLLPVPSLAQTVSWLSNAPAVLEECAHAATQPQLLKTLLEHQMCLGHLEAAASLPPNMGDSILASLSLPPSGRVRSNQSTGTKNPAADQSDGTQAKGETSFVTPVIGLISNEEVPFMISAKRRTPRGEDASKENSKFTLVKPRQTPKDVGVKDDGERVEEEGKASKRSSGMKRKQADGSDFDEEEEVLGIIKSARKRTSQGFRSGASGPTQGQDQQGRSENKDVGAKTTRNNMCNRAALESRMTQLGVKALRLPEDPSLCSIFLSCLSSQPKVVLQKLAVTASASASRSGSGGKSFYSKQQKRRRRSPVKAPSRSNLPQKPDLDYTGLDDKENHPVSPSISSSPAHQRTNAETAALPGESEDYVADSEDEATKNFKGRLFMKRYYKTKHGTYVPTLREYFKPGMARRDLSAAGIKRR